MPSPVLRVSAIPATLGLVTAGHQASVDETALWQAQNMTSDLDGILGVRPGLRPYGQVLVRPDIGTPDPITGLYPNIVAFSSFLSGLSGFYAFDNSGGAKISLSTHKGVLLAAVSKTATGAYTLSYSVPALSAKTRWSFRFLIQGVNMPAYNGTDTTAGTFAFRVQGVASTCKEFALYSGGLYWRRNDNSKYTLVTGSEFAGLGGYNTLELRSNGTSISVYLNDALIDTLTAASLATVTPATTCLFEFWWRPDTNTTKKTYNTRIVTPMYNDVATDPFVTDPVVAIGEFQFDTRSGSKKRCVLAACGDYIYHDLDLREVWRPLHTKVNALVNMSTYRQNAVWVDYNGAGTSAIWLWNGVDDAPEQLTDAPPAEAVVEHQQRLWVIGDHSNPYRAYYSADRQPNVWWTPSPTTTEEQFDVALDAGFVEIPATKRADRCTAMFGDYNQSIIIWTRKSTWGITGFGPFSYTRNPLHPTIGCEGQNSVTMVGNDLWFTSRSGMRSIVASQQSGEITVQQPMMVLHQMWANTGRSELLVNTGALAQAYMDFDSSLGLVHIALPMFGYSTAGGTFVYNVNSQQSHGPWIIDARSMRTVEIGTPLREVVMYGDSQGRTAYIDPMHRVDFRDTPIEAVIESPIITGRSQDPRLIGYGKTFSKLKLYVLVRGDWDLNVTWSEYRHELPPENGSYTVNQNVLLKSFVVDKDFRVDCDPDGLVMSGEQASVIDVLLDACGYGLSWKIVTSNDLVLLGWEVEFTAPRSEQE